jgi:16S rRNA (cytidine1402-2'-O)-methyltransferase
MLPALYLIPTPIAEDGLYALPEHTLDVARHLEIFVVEKAKTARHFLKSIGLIKPLPETVVVEIEDLPAATQTLRQAIDAGKSVGVLSEAGCPGVADPGAALVAFAHQAGIRVVPLTGPSSLLLALMASGMNGQGFTFHGYLSPKRPELARDLRRLEQQSEQRKQTQLFIETPYRSQMVVEVALESLHPDTVFGIAQDLTGTAAFNRSLRVRQWKKQSPVLEKLPAVFLVYVEGK